MNFIFYVGIFVIFKFVKIVINVGCKWVERVYYLWIEIFLRVKEIVFYYYVRIIGVNWEFFVKLGCGYGYKKNFVLKLVLFVNFYLYYEERVCCCWKKGVGKGS